MKTLGKVSNLTMTETRVYHNTVRPANISLICVDNESEAMGSSSCNNTDMHLIHNQQCS